MRRSLLISLGCAMAVALLVQGGFAQLVLLSLSIELVTPALVVLLAIIGLARLRGKSLDPVYCKCVALSALILIASIVSFLMGCGVHQLRWNATRQYVAALVPVLDEAKERTGHYPAALPSEPDRFVRWFSFPLRYSDSHDGFEFWYDDPGGLMDSYSLNSTDRTWRYHG